ncbi:MAG: hypothetical protein IKB71_08315, partial [Lentisphaeria bacterium]|nr:hypothetical protein [Lentisphaeria bacterium]
YQLDCRVSVHISRTGVQSFVFSLNSLTSLNSLLLVTPCRTHTAVPCHAVFATSYNAHYMNILQTTHYPPLSNNSTIFNNYKHFINIFLFFYLQSTETKKEEKEFSS